jgi:hypothetical protein
MLTGGVVGDSMDCTRRLLGCSCIWCSARPRTSHWAPLRSCRSWWCHRRRFGCGLCVYVRMVALAINLTGRGRHDVGRVCSVPVILCWIDAAGHGAATSWYDSMLCVIAWSIDMCCGGGMQAFLLTLSPSQSSPRSPLLRRSLSAWVRSRLALSGSACVALLTRLMRSTEAVWTVIY